MADSRIRAAPRKRGRPPKIARHVYEVGQKVKVDYEGQTFSGVIVDPKDFAHEGALTVKQDEPFKGEQLFSIYYPNDDSFEHNVLKGRIVGAKQQEKRTPARRPVGPPPKVFVGEFWVGQKVKVNFEGLVWKAKIVDPKAFESEGASAIKADEPYKGQTLYSVQYQKDGLFEHNILIHRIKRSKPGRPSRFQEECRQFVVGQTVTVDYEGDRYVGVVVDPKDHAEDGAMETKAVEPHKGEDLFSIFYPDDSGGSFEHNVLQGRVVDAVKLERKGSSLWTDYETELISRAREESSSNAAPQSTPKKRKKKTKPKPVVARVFDVGDFVCVRGMGDVEAYKGVVVALASGEDIRESGEEESSGEGDEGIVYTVLDYEHLSQEAGVRADRLDDDVPDLSWDTVCQWNHAAFKIGDKVKVDYEGTEWDAVIVRPPRTSAGSMSVNPLTLGWIMYSVYYPSEDSKEHGCSRAAYESCKVPKVTVGSPKSRKRKAAGDDRSAENSGRKDKKRQKRGWKKITVVAAPLEECVVCGKSTANSKTPVLICDGCDCECHLRCAKLRRVPKGDFICPVCVKKQHEDKSAQEKKSKRKKGTKRERAGRGTKRKRGRR